MTTLTGNKADFNLTLKQAIRIMARKLPGRTCFACFIPANTCVSLSYFRLYFSIASESLFRNQNLVLDLLGVVEAFDAVETKSDWEHFAHLRNEKSEK